MAIKGKIYMYTQHVGDGFYQVFIKNISYPADFFSYTRGRFLKNGDGKKEFFTEVQGIVSPFSKDLKLHLGNFNINQPDFRRHYFIDTKLRKPTRTVELLEAVTPPKAKLKKMIGSEAEFEIKLRKTSMSVSDYVDSIRFNMKERYYFLQSELKILKTSNKENKEEFIKMIMGELLQLNELASLYNQGVPIKDVGGLEYHSYYEWMIKDFGFKEPNGKPPKEFLKIDLGLPEEK